MSLRYKGALLSATPPTTSQTGATGLWSLQQQFQARGSNNWPTNGPYFVEDVFSTYLYTGTGSTQTINNGINLSGEGGLVWVKTRGSNEGHGFFDTARGTGKFLRSNTTGAEVTDSLSLTSFNSDGFTAGTDQNNGIINYPWGSGGDKYVSWTFRKAKKFFDVITYTGDGVNGRNINHNLGSTPGCIIVKCTSQAYDWMVYHRSAGSPAYDYRLRLNATAAAASSSSSYWGGTAPTSTQFTVGNNAYVNESGQTYVAYLFAHDAGGFGDASDQSVIKCGSFTTNGSGSATVTLDWEPQWLLIKKSSAATGESSDRWRIHDNMRGIPTGSADAALDANTTNANYTTDYLNLTPTGFEVINAILTADTTFVYIAIRRGPMKTPTDATKVFKTIFRSGTSATASVTGVGFSPDTALIKNTLGNSNSVDWSHNFFDKLRSPGYRLSTTFTDAEDTATSFITSFDQDGMTLPATGYTATNGSSYTYVNHFFKRAPKFFDTVCYTGTGTARTVNHNLGIAPELMIVRRRDTGSSWYMWGGNMPMTNTMFLEQTTASADNAAYFNDTAPTSSVFSVNSAANTSGATYIAYLFGSCPGVSKVGTYTGNGGTAQNIDCGFTNGARFVLIKSTGTGNWFVFNSVRGIVDAGDRYLMLNSVDAEDNSLDIIDPYSAGFAIANTTYVNTNGVTYIYLAIA